MWLKNETEKLVKVAVIAWVINGKIYYREISDILRWKKSPPRIQLTNDKDIEKIVLLSDAIPYVNFPHGIHKIMTGHDFFQKLSRREYTINLISNAFSIPWWSMVRKDPMIGWMFITSGLITFVLSSPVRKRNLAELLWNDFGILK